MHEPTIEHWALVKRLLRYLYGTHYHGRNPVSWSSKKQQTIPRSSIKAEYLCVTNTTVEMNWVCSLLNDLVLQPFTCLVIYCDNIGANQLCSNLFFHSRMKHVSIDFHFIRDQVQNGTLQVAYISSVYQLAYILTKPQYIHGMCLHLYLQIE
ncbi:Retrovirus-related Pol polyprotein from transposon TNT 1-94 [Gossypium australe]|uniref:Retrovirus-related Pol polyprotein from transposon TNT 1-94 n=1 Tax=Gossypium australe TaxID=47621 RepID=A0A5B6W8M7_9ROSI|nr:Retrovirus-related Pol polyprotein from transposon TNT 1-94 [Gossypium australe]